MNTQTSPPPLIEDAKAVVRQNTEEVPGKGNFDLFEELFADDFVDHTTADPVGKAVSRILL